MYDDNAQRNFEFKDTLLHPRESYRKGIRRKRKFEESCYFERQDDDGNMIWEGKDGKEEYVYSVSESCGSGGGLALNLVEVPAYTCSIYI